MTEDAKIIRVARRMALWAEQSHPTSMITDADEPRLSDSTVNAYKRDAADIVAFLRMLDAQQ